MEYNEILETLEPMQTFGLSLMRQTSVALKDRTFEIYSGQTDDTFDHMTEEDDLSLNTPPKLIELLAREIWKPENDMEMFRLNNLVVLVKTRGDRGDVWHPVPLDIKKSEVYVDNEGTVSALLRRNSDMTDATLLNGRDLCGGFHIDIPQRKVLSYRYVPVSDLATFEAPLTPFVHWPLDVDATFVCDDMFKLPRAPNPVPFHWLRSVPYCIRFEERDANGSEVLRYSWALRNAGGNGFIRSFDKERAAELRAQRDKLETALAEYVPRVCTDLIGHIATIQHTDYIIGVPKGDSFFTLTLKSQIDMSRVSAPRRRSAFYDSSGNDDDDDDPNGEPNYVDWVFDLSEAYYGQVNGKRVLYFGTKDDDEKLVAYVVIAVEIDVLEVES
eukprot:GHVS01002665.1.p1 GENE.GHVS01002665.1~~GHVS01002665.1.p1  ORF type:complete len:386 (-),score=28.16 GHVS01002665.1:223-1380(-)